MISVVMPTMWRNNKTIRLLGSLNSDPNISEIILIDNDVKSKNVDLSKFSKVKYVPQVENIYVNPAWNLGVSLCKSEIICIVNDDIYFDSNIVSDYVIKHSDNLGVFGLNMHSAMRSNRGEISKIELISKEDKRKSIIGAGFGMLMFVKKSNWKPIPKDLKIWYGDNWIIRIHKNVYKLNLHGSNLEVDRHTTAGSKELREVTRKDTLEWSTYKDI